MNILLISYYFKKQGIVGSARLSYWYDRLHDEGYKIRVITADTDSSDRKNIILVPDIDSVFTRAIKFFIKDNGISWYFALMKKLNSIEIIDNNRKIAIISGSPFMHFGIQKQLKKFGYYVILDFRDPFAMNPRFPNKKLKIFMKKQFEKYFISMANQIITVNEDCKKLISNPSNCIIINNGFDERIINEISHSKKIIQDKVIISYAGTLYNDRNPTNFLKTIKDKFPQTILFQHIGPKSYYLEDFLSAPFVKTYGIRSYRETCQHLWQSEIGVIFTSGDPFESTTKVFDYIGCSLRILIITDGVIKTGSLHETTKNYPEIFWANNNIVDIHNILNFLLLNRRNHVNESDRSAFSRDNGFIKINQEIKKQRR